MDVGYVKGEATCPILWSDLEGQWDPEHAATASAPLTQKMIEFTKASSLSLFQSVTR